MGAFGDEGGRGERIIAMPGRCKIVRRDARCRIQDTRYKIQENPPFSMGEKEVEIELAHTLCEEVGNEDI